MKLIRPWGFSSVEQADDSRWRRALIGLVVVALLAVLVFGVVLAVMADRTSRFKAEQVVGVVSEQPADVVLSATRRWAAVAGSDAFRYQLATSQQLPQDTFVSLSVIQAEAAPVITVSVGGANQEQADSRLRLVIQHLVASSTQADARFPLVALTEPATVPVEGISDWVFALGAALVVLGGGGVLVYKLVRPPVRMSALAGRSVSNSDRPRS